MAVKVEGDGGEVDSDALGDTTDVHQERDGAGEGSPLAVFGIFGVFNGLAEGFNYIVLVAAEIVESRFASVDAEAGDGIIGNVALTPSADGAEDDEDGQKNVFHTVFIICYSFVVVGVGTGADRCVSDDTLVGAPVAAGESTQNSAAKLQENSDFKQNYYTFFNNSTYYHVINQLNPSPNHRRGSGGLSDQDRE